MGFKKIILTIFLLISFCTTPVLAAYQVDARTERIPAGTVMKLKFQDMVSTISSVSGDQFNATLAEDVIVKDTVVLPAGTILRGTVKKVKHTGIAKRPGMVVLSFDHVVTPMGRQIPIVVRLVNFNNLTKDGAVSGGGNYYTKVKDNFDDSVDLVKSSVDLGFDIGEFWNGYPRIATVPITAVGGTCASVLMFVGKSAVDVFMKGNEVTMKKGDVFSVMLIDSLDVPLN